MTSANQASRIFGASPIPRYAQIADLLKSRIQRGLLRTGERLPSNEQLMAEFGVARITIRQALDRVAQEGLIRAQHGRGTFVTSQIPDDRWLHVETNLGDLAKAYRAKGLRIVNLSEENGQPPLTKDDGRPAPSYRHIRRIHIYDGKPYSLMSIHIDQRIFLKKPHRFRTEGIISTLLELGRPDIGKARQVLTIRTADMETANHLDIAVNAPVAEIRRVLSVENGMVIYFGELTYRGDFVRVDMNLMT